MREIISVTRTAAKIPRTAPSDTTSNPLIAVHSNRHSVSSMRAAGDSATDFSFYTKRATLAGIYGATLLYWLEDRSPGFAETRVFLDRRLVDAARIGAARRRIDAAIDRLPNPFRLLRPLR